MTSQEIDGSHIKVFGYPVDATARPSIRSIRNVMSVSLSFALLNRNEATNGNQSNKSSVTTTASLMSRPANTIIHSKGDAQTAHGDYA